MQPKSYRYFDLIMVAFVAILVCSNLIGPAKITEAQLPFIGTISFSAAVLFFPLSYVFGDILTEVYGYARARRVIWTGFAALLFATAMTAIMLALPAASFGTSRRPTKPFSATPGGSWSLRSPPISAVSSSTPTCSPR